MMASDRDSFARSLALECLWDCEDDVRFIGCKHVELTLSNARMRLEALSQDLHEEQTVRDPAGERLAL